MKKGLERSALEESAEISDFCEHISFKDILMESQREVEADLIGHDDELIF